MIDCDLGIVSMSGIVGFSCITTNPDSAEHIGHWVTWHTATLFYM